MTHAARPRLAAIGTDGLLTLLLSNVVLLATFGVLYAWQLVRVIGQATDARTDAPTGAALVVLGMRLRGDVIGADYRARLERAWQLYLGRSAAPILVVGGPSGSGRVSEAERGRDWLLARGVSDAHLLTEAASLNTLENLRHVRTLVTERGRTEFVMITNRYHLARSELIARGLGMYPRLCGAEDRLHFAPRIVGRLLLEAYYMHWYLVGAVWSKLAGRRRSLARIS